MRDGVGFVPGSDDGGLYAEIEPFATHRIAVDEIHELYVEECGRPEGTPALFVHGGPGGGIEARSRRFFDPSHYRIVLFDQRGAGKSRPHAETRGNETPALISDIEIVRRALGIDRWLVFGGSWGSSLSLLYAEAHRERVLGLIVHGIFLCRPFDFRWIYEEAGPTQFPDAYDRLIVSRIPEAERGDLISAFHRRITSDDRAEREDAAEAWAEWEATVSTVRPNPDFVRSLARGDRAVAMASLELHYFTNACFLRPDQILEDTAKIHDVPGRILHGRQDAVCPPSAAWDLARAWPAAELHWVDGAGHADTEPDLRDALVHATDAFRDGRFDPDRGPSSAKP